VWAALVLNPCLISKLSHKTDGESLQLLLLNMDSGDYLNLCYVCP
jgi:hypothetical protein